VVRRLRNIKYQGSTATVHLALSGPPDFDASQEQLSGDIVLCPSLEYAERAYDAAKHGQLSPEPVLIARIPSLLDAGLAPVGQHVMSVTVRYAPYHLRDGDWDSHREAVGDLALRTLEHYAPGLSKLVLHRNVITPLDYERNYGLAEGAFTQGQMGLDQLLTMRPIPGFAGYRSPVDGLYLGGDGAHPGGGVSGRPGYNAAKQILEELR
jgi:phytoene dehydrogenase-like protein